MRLKLNEENSMYLIRNVGKLYQEMMEVQQNGNKNKDFIKRVDEILECMSKEYVLIIKNDFLKESNQDWYLKYFTKKDYFAYKKGAIKTFLRCLYR